MARVFRSCLSRPPPPVILPLWFHRAHLSLRRKMSMGRPLIVEFTTGRSPIILSARSQLNMKAKAKPGVRRVFHRNGVVAMEEHLRGHALHGPHRTWHRNGKLASEEFYRDGLLHGICRQWNENGKLLGSFRMKQGTGIQKSWHQNGRLNLEFSTVGGAFHGRSRLWLQDGTLLSDQIYLHGRLVTPDAYRKAARQNPSLPKLRGRIAKARRPTPQHIHQVFVSALLKKPNRSEAKVWLNAGDKNRRLLGHFKKTGEALKFVEELYQAGAVKVIAPDVYTNKRGDQFADALLVQLPRTVKARNSVRKACGQLRSRKLGAVEPDRDIGETHLFLSMA
jgi:MORN repeat variant